MELNSELRVYPHVNVMQDSIGCQFILGSLGQLTEKQVEGKEKIRRELSRIIRVDTKSAREKDKNQGNELRIQLKSG